MTRIGFTRGLKDPAQEPADDPADTVGADASLGFVVACTALAVLALALSLTVFFTLRGLGRDHAPPPVAPLAVTVPVQEFPVAPAAPAAIQLKSAPATPTAPPAAPTAGPAPAPPPASHAEAMIAVLRRAKGVLTLQVENDPGAEASARDITSFFKAAGWTVNWNSSFGTGPRRVGLSAALGDTAQDNAIRDAFKGSAVKFGPPPRNVGVVQTPEIFVGADGPSTSEP